MASAKDTGRWMHRGKNSDTGICGYAVRMWDLTPTLGHLLGFAEGSAAIFTHAMCS